ncbi:aminomethyltransferase [Halohasta litchfieldiae]|uniref:Probable aminomethyltransferase n=1 Tax=Halohasta litchfieldiae TaxID=1073996 RepID=A0A1H6RJ98_9EURY|nr:glycine cleavage system aminomethyltransferase GcvT [Halohasta litchfieldiae]ATW89669.1 aminomethyltransferase [Halohasta litchfieldiae]SEI54556.1 aminomethyltransferase [Halohasta litchfieldiae]
MARRHPPLAERHTAHGASVTEFGGWEMPVEFDSIKTEHAAVRDHVGIFDVSHMSEIEVTGRDATQLMDRLTTNDVASLSPGRAQYACITREDGVILDDTVVYRLPDREGEAAYLFIPNAGHDSQFTEWWIDHRDEWGLTASVDNVTEQWAMFAVQGPEAPAHVAAAADDSILDLSRFEHTRGEIAGVDCRIARTGYTGEDGFEILCPTADAEAVWTAFDCQPCGLGARDTLRIEMGFLLSGQDFDPTEEPRTPYEADIAFTVDLDTDFVGRDALADLQEQGVDQTFVGVTMLERGVPRNGYQLVDEAGEEIGTLTSGTMSPTLSEGIGLGYVDIEHATPDESVSIVVRGTEKRAELTALPFVSK